MDSRGWERNKPRRGARGRELVGGEIIVGLTEEENGPAGNSGAEEGCLGWPQPVPMWVGQCWRWLAWMEDEPPAQ